ncbi:unnamed protein product [Enterobius vermicularis]|uniref:MADS-box domain-containing protein n=1 Tax=Enterobius vermicularis TaxID=51028 RepID=A0A0N4VJR0_ENTVE|nr:unnamed protein product [Enterobius vermicularis]
MGRVKWKKLGREKRNSRYGLTAKLSFCCLKMHLLTNFCSANTDNFVNSDGDFDSSGEEDEDEDDDDGI